MDGVDFAHLIEDIDGYLCEIGAAQIRDGLHVLGQAPDAKQLPDMLCALTRLPNVGVPSLPTEVARYYGLDFATLLQDKGKRLDGSPEALAGVAARALITRADAIEAIESVCRVLYSVVQQHNFDSSSIDRVIQDCLGSREVTVAHDVAQDVHTRVLGSPRTDTVDRIAAVLKFACDELVPNLARTTDEIDNLLRGLDGRYVKPA